jgi:hypothetical protein
MRRNKIPVPIRNRIPTFRRPALSSSTERSSKCSPWLRSVTPGKTLSEPFIFFTVDNVMYKLLLKFTYWVWCKLTTPIYSVFFSSLSSFVCKVIEPSHVTMTSFLHMTIHFLFICYAMTFLLPLTHSSHYIHMTFLRRCYVFHSIFSPVQHFPRPHRFNSRQYMMSCTLSFTALRISDLCFPVKKYPGIPWCDEKLNIHV